MKRLHTFLTVTLVLLSGSCFGTQAAVDFYSPASDHIWNRLYSSLFVRTAGDQVFDDWMDPLFSRETNHFLTGESNTKTIALLGDFEKDRNALAHATPLQRAVMQRDLFAMFHWARSFEKESENTPERKKLIRALVGAIRHVALTADEIRNLSDNYAIAAGLPGAHTTFDPAQPKRAFLPKDLLADDGPWLALEPRQDRPLTAPVHFSIFLQKSAFDLHFHHPQGRAAGKKYLDTLAAMKNPFLAKKPATPVPTGAFEAREGRWLNPDTPQFPPGTMWALVRRAILVDVKGNLVVSPLIESVEVRVYRALADLETNPDAQTFFEWELSRRLLFGKGGFHLMEGRDLSLSPFFGTDVETYAKRRPNEPLACFACHAAPGIHSVKSRTLQFFSGDYEYEPKSEPKRPAQFRPTTRKRLAEVTEKLAGKQEGWKEFRRVWDEK